MNQKGRVWIFGDDVNTDLIIPGKYLELVDPEEMAEHAMEGIDPEFPKKIQEGDIVVGGTNFGCGSSREHAPLVLKMCGVGAVLAETASRLFFRNAINVGLPILLCDTSGIQEGDELEVDLAGGTVHDRIQGFTVTCSRISQSMLHILEEGGLVEYIKNHGDFEF